MSSFANAVYPVPDRYIDLGKEVSPGSTAAATFTFPMTTFTPVDKYTYLEDTSWRNSMAQLYNLIQGVRISDLTMGGPFFADGMGYPILDIMGDYWQGVSVGTTTTSTSLAVSGTVGAGSITVNSGTGISVNDIISIGGTATTACEVRQVTAISGTVITLNAALYQAHASGSASGTVVVWSDYNGIIHNFSLQNNSLGAGGWTQSQPPTYTYYDFSGVPASSGARQYSYTCFSEVVITSDPTKLLEWTGKAMALASSIAGSAPVVSVSDVAPQAAWQSTVDISGTGTLDISMWKLTLTRKVEPLYTNSNQQDPFAIPRGYLTAELALDQEPSSDELLFLDYLDSTQPTVKLTSTNGLTGSAAASLTVTASKAGFDTGAIQDSKDVFGYSVTAKLIANTTDSGPSAGYSPCSIQLINNVISY